MRRFPRKFSMLDKIDFLQREIIILSIAYYELDYNIVPDEKYDEVSRDLVKLIKECPEREQSQYWYVFYDFDGTTGFDLRGRLTEKDNEYLTHLAYFISGKGMPIKQEVKPIKKKGRLF